MSSFAGHTPEEDESLILGRSLLQPPIWSIPLLPSYPAAMAERDWRPEKIWYGLGGRPSRLARCAGRSAESYPAVGSSEGAWRDSRPNDCAGARGSPAGSQLRYSLAVCRESHRSAAGGLTTSASGADCASGICLATRGRSPHPVRFLRPVYTQPPGPCVGRYRGRRTRTDDTPCRSESAAAIGNGRKPVTPTLFQEPQIAHTGWCGAPLMT